MQDQFVNTSPAFTRQEFLQTLLAASERWKLRKKNLETLVSQLPLLLFGFGGKGQVLAHHIRNNTQHDLYVYDISLEKRALARDLGFKVVDEINPHLCSQSAVIFGACQAQLEQKKIVGANFIYYQEASVLFSAPYLENLTVDFSEYILKNVNELYEVATNLNLGAQRNFLAVLTFRLSLDPTDLHSTRRPSNSMWIDIPSQLRARSYDNFLDVGAFDGDTLNLFQDAFSCRRGIAVEANTKLFDEITSVSNKYLDGIKILPIAAWSKTASLNFIDLGFGMVKIIEDVQGPLQAAPIDNFVSERVDILKMDIEGSEAQALEGATKLLTCWRPDLAIAAYHRPSDFVNLYAQLGRYGYHDVNFEWHFAHYSDCIDDSIFYVIYSELKVKTEI
jgi:FkbM family methyltransferase